MRIQILELPTKYVGDTAETPFVIVVSETEPFGPHASGLIEAYTGLKQSAGAAHVFVTDAVVEIGPPNPVEAMTMKTDEALKALQF